MKKIAIATMALLSSLLYSCEKNNEIDLQEQSAQSLLSDVSVVNGRLLFKNQEAYAKVFKLPAEELQKLVEKSGINNLGKSLTDSENDNSYANKMRNSTIAPPLYYIANSSGEYQIANEIVWLDGEKQHFAENETSLSAIKRNPVLSSKFFDLKPIAIKHNLSNAKVLTSNQSDAKFISQYTLGSFDFRHVYVLQQFYDSMVGVNTYITINFDYRSAGTTQKWKWAGETREIAFNISSVKVNGATKLPPAGVQWVRNNFNFSSNSGPYFINIFSASGWPTSSNNYLVNGIIYQKAINIPGHSPYTTPGTYLSALWD